MARPRSTDFLQNHKFAIVEIPHDPTERSAFFDREGIIAAGSAMVGCKSITIPETTVDTLEINEGTEMFSHHVNTGRARTGECIISFAVIPAGSVGLYSWIHRAIYGIGSPRKDFAVYHFANTRVGPDTVASRIYFLEGCVPTAYKPSSDLDGEDDAVSLEEITFHCHRVKLELPPNNTETDVTLRPGFFTSF